MMRLSSSSTSLLRMSPSSQSAENNFWFCVLMCPRYLMSCSGRHLPLLRIMTQIHCPIIELILLKTQLHWFAIIVLNAICRVLFWSPAWQQQRHFPSLLAGFHSKSGDTAVVSDLVFKVNHGLIHPWWPEFRFYFWPNIRPGTYIINLLWSNFSLIRHQFFFVLPDCLTQ